MPGSNLVMGRTVLKFVRVPHSQQVIQCEIVPFLTQTQASNFPRNWFKDEYLTEVEELLQPFLSSIISFGNQAKKKDLKIFYQDSLVGQTIRMGFNVKRKSEAQTLLIHKPKGGRASSQVFSLKLMVYVCPRSHLVSGYVKVAFNQLLARETQKDDQAQISSYFQRVPEKPFHTAQNGQDVTACSNSIPSSSSNSRTNSSVCSTSGTTNTFPSVSRSPKHGGHFASVLDARHSAPSFSEAFVSNTSSSRAPDRGETKVILGDRTDSVKMDGKEVSPTAVKSSPRCANKDISAAVCENVVASGGRRTALKNILQRKMEKKQLSRNKRKSSRLLRTNTVQNSLLFHVKKSSVEDSSTVTTSPSETAKSKSSQSVKRPKTTVLLKEEERYPPDSQLPQLSTPKKRKENNNSAGGCSANVGDKLSFTHFKRCKDSPKPHSSGSTRDELKNKVPPSSGKKNYVNASNHNVSINNLSASSSLSSSEERRPEKRRRPKHLSVVVHTEDVQEAVKSVSSNGGEHDSNLSLPDLETYSFQRQETSVQGDSGVADHSDDFRLSFSGLVKPENINKGLTDYSVQKKGGTKSGRPMSCLESHSTKELKISKRHTNLSCDSKRQIHTKRQIGLSKFHVKENGHSTDCKMINRLESTSEFGKIPHIKEHSAGFEKSESPLHTRKHSSSASPQRNHYSSTVKYGKKRELMSEDKASISDSGKDPQDSFTNELADKSMLDQQHSQRTSSIEFQHLPSPSLHIQHQETDSRRKLRTGESEDRSLLNVSECSSMSVLEEIPPEKEPKSLVLMLSDKELEKRVLMLKEELKAVFKGEIHSERHHQYMQGGIKRRQLDHQVHLQYFREGQEDVVMDVLLRIFTQSQFKNLDFMMRVMLPEALMRVYKQITGTSWDGEP